MILFLAPSQKFTKIVPSGVRALPLAAGINEGGHYFRYYFTCWDRRYSKPQKGLL
jgi:hypothetical protein